MPGVTDILSLGAAPEGAKVVCIFVHGRNQTPEEMEAAVLGRLSVPDVAYLLPRAGDRTWYRALAVDPRTVSTQSDLGQSLADLGALIRDARARAPGVPLVLAGFSQGACLALEHAFTGLDVPDTVIAFTGCRVGVPADTRPQSLAKGLPVYLSGGDADPWIPVSAFAQAVQDLGTCGAALRADVFPGRGHQVSDPEVALLGGVLSDLAAARTPRMEASR